MKIFCFLAGSLILISTAACRKKTLPDVATGLYETDNKLGISSLKMYTKDGEIKNKFIIQKYLNNLSIPIHFSLYVFIEPFNGNKTIFEFEDRKERVFTTIGGVRTEQELKKYGTQWIIGPIDVKVQESAPLPGREGFNNINPNKWEQGIPVNINNQYNSIPYYSALFKKADGWWVHPHNVMGVFNQETISHLQPGDTLLVQYKELHLIKMP